MSKNYIKSAVSAEITEKKSRFIAYLTPVEDEAGALAFIDKIKKKHYDARHNCSAYITGLSCGHKIFRRDTAWNGRTG